MKYSYKISLLEKKWQKKYNRKDGSFAMMTIHHLVNDLEDGNYDTNKYTMNDIDMVCEVLYTKYQEHLKIWTDKLDSPEYKNRYKYF